ncbi:MAG: RNase H family protein [Pirellulales bacterium]
MSPVPTRVSPPKYLLFCTARRADDRGQWRFVLRQADGSERLEASDWEAEASLERLELLAVVRGLEALDQPAQVTLVTSSRYLALGFNFGLTEWSAAGWQWERFGEMVPVKHADLWQRVDQALAFHEVQCRTLRTDRGATPAPTPHYAWSPAQTGRAEPAVAEAAPAERPMGRMRDRAAAALSWLGKGRTAEHRQPSWVGAG